MTQTHSEQRNRSTRSHSPGMGSSVAWTNRERAICKEIYIAIQSSLGACVHAATRISNKITNINAPKPTSITSLIKSGFSMSSLRTNHLPRNKREVRVTALRGSTPRNLKREGRSLPARPPPTKQARPLPSLGGETQPTSLPYRIPHNT